MNRKTGVILAYIFMVFEILSTLILTPFIIRTLGQAEYGVYKLSASINGYLLILDLGVGNAIIRYVSKFRVNNDHESQQKFLGVVTLYYGFIAILTIIIGLILVGVFPVMFSKGLSESEIHLGQKLLTITMFNSAVTLGTAAYNNVLVAYQRYTVSKGYAILQIIIRMILTFAALKAGMGSVGIVCVNLLMTVLCRGAFVCYVLKVLKLKPTFKGIQLDFIKEIVAYSSWVLLQLIATQINASADQLLIGAMVSSSATLLAVYSVGTQIVQYFQSVGSSFTGVLMPGIVTLVEKGGNTRQFLNEMIRIGRILFMVLGVIWACFLLYGRQFVVLWAGEENSNAFYVAMLLISAQLPIITQTVGTQILWAKNEHREAAIIKIVIVLLNIALTIALIQWRPLMGACIGTFISLILGDIVARNIVYKKKIGISITQYYCGLLKGILPSIIIVLISGLLIRQSFDSEWAGFFVKVFLSCCVYMICLLLFGMNQYEKKLVMTLLKLNRNYKQ